jgi:hypothetical protein
MRLGTAEARTTEEPAAGKLCAMVRTECIVPRGDRSARQKTSRRPAFPDAERIGNKSLAGKREMSEDVYGMGLQRLCDMVRAGLCQPSWPVGEPYTRRSHVWRPDAIESDGFEFCPSYALLNGRCSARALQDMNGAPTSHSYVPPERNMGSPTGREAHGDGILAVPNWECCNGMTQTDHNVCRWLAAHRPGDPVRGRAGEGE